ncbi:MAG TPA: hypothetical protein V6C84_12345 [Coleofasciculaceae cyanobacterium]|jgi:hypothetical protein
MAENVGYRSTNPRSISHWLDMEPELESSTFLETLSGQGGVRHVI